MLGKIVTDDEIRARFFRSPVGTCEMLGLNLTEVEMDAISGVLPDRVSRFAMSLDPRIVRVTLGVRQSAFAGAGEGRQAGRKAFQRPSENMALRPVEWPQIEQDEMAGA